MRVNFCSMRGKDCFVRRPSYGMEVQQKHDTMNIAHVSPSYNVQFTAEAHNSCRPNLFVAQLLPSHLGKAMAVTTKQWL